MNTFDSYFIKKLQSFPLLILILTVLTGCGTSLTREELYPKIYVEKPVSILIMPPINQTNHIDAKEYFYSSLMMPLAEKGYYIFSPYLSEELLQQESANDAEQFIDTSLKPFLNVFNTDAVLFTIIKKWDKSSILSTINVEAEYILKSAHTNEVLFQRNADIVVDCSVTQNAGLLGMVANALATAATDKIVGARKTNSFIVSDMPEGKYSPMYGVDKKQSTKPQNISGTTVR